MSSIFPNNEFSTKICVLTRAIIVDDDHILLCKTKTLANNFYFLPGGHVEHRETTSEALIRELKEETDYDFQIVKFLGCIEHLHAPNTQSLCHNHDYNFIYLCSNPSFKVVNILRQPEQGQDLEWINLDHLANIDIKPTNLHSLIYNWLNHNNYEKFITHIDETLLNL